MTATIVAFFFFFFVPIPQAQQLPANTPPVCANAIARYRIAAQQFNAEHATKFQQIFGRPQGAVDLPRECPQAIQLYRWKLPRVKALLAPWKHAAAECAGVGLNVVARNAYSPPQLIAGMQQRMAESCH
jgi:hypothetical protein